MSASAPIRKPAPLDYGLMLAAAIMWASAFIAIKIAVPDTGPVWLAAIRVTFGFVALLPYALWRGLAWPASRGQWVLITAMACMNMVVPFFLIAWGGKTLDAGVLALLIGTGPILALIGSHFLTDDDRLTPHKLVAVALGFTGIMVVVGPSAAAGLGHGDLQAKAAVLGASLCYVIAGLLIRRIAMPPVRLACLALGIGSALLIPLALAFQGAPPLGISINSAMALVFLGVFPTGLAYILRFHLIRTVGYTRFAMATNMVPVFGVMLGALILDEPLSLNVLIALALVLTGLVVASRGAKRD